MPHLYIRPIILCLCSMLAMNGLYGQEPTPYVLKLRTGAVNIAKLEELPAAPQPEEIFERVYFRLIQFNEIPSVQEKSWWAERGVTLLDYLPNYAFLARVNAGHNWTAAETAKIRSLIKIDDRIKLHPDLFKANYPSWAMVSADEILVNVVFFPGPDYHSMKNDLLTENIEIITGSELTGKVTLKVKTADLKSLSNKPFINFIEPIDQPAHPENYTARTLHRSNFIAGDYDGSPKYDGTGITLGMHDDGIIGPHIDYEGRIPIQYPNTNDGDHGDHVAGTIMGAGNLDPMHKGMAFGADLFVYSSSNNNYDSVPSHYANFDVVITSKSYSNGCNAGYTSLSRELDRYVRQNPSLMHVFSAGNDGTSDCGYGAGAGWGNITGGHKAGKNVITVANLNSTDGLAGSSSRGPAEDGRIKPDVSAKGSSVISTTDINDYVSKSGTSMSCPGVSGSLAQLYHAYRDLNGGNYPPSGLMKGIMMNSADDIGNPGPDFRHGYGRINNRRAVEVLENAQYQSDVVSQGDTNLHNFFVPAGVKQLKVMTCWNDFEASSSAAIALVNNLDFDLTDPSSTTYLPWMLDPTPIPAALNSNAVRGIDDLNNMEQVTIDNPVSGLYTARIKGKVVPQGPQEYFIVYTFVMDEVTVTYPNGGEPIVPGETELVRWDSPETPNNFTIEYSVNNGASWNLISTVAGSVRHANWGVPSSITSQARIRVSNNGKSDVSDTSFTILGVPANLHVEWACPDSVKLAWNGVSGAVEYEASMLGNKYMDSTGRSTVTSIVLQGIQPFDQKWFSVKAIAPGGGEGRRAIAIQQPLGTFGCPIKDDVSVVAVVSPANSVPDCKDNSASTVKVWVKNQGINPVSNIPVNYRIGSGAVVTEMLTSTIQPGDSMLFSFTTTEDLSTSGNYPIESWTSLATDFNFYNDSILTIVASVESDLVQLPWSEDFEDFELCGIFNNCGATTCDLANGWHNHQNFVIDDIDWRTDNDGTRTDDSGPSTDHNPGTTEGKYLYTETSNSCDFATALMITPCIDLSKSVEPELSFWYHMFGEDIGTLYIDVLYQQQWVHDLLVFRGPRGDTWREAKLDLSPFNGDTINIRFRGVTDLGPYGDMAVDDINVTDLDPIGINEGSSADAKFYVFPNPTDGKVHFLCRNMGEGEVSLVISDMGGKIVYSQKFASAQILQTVPVDLSQLDGGIYLVQLQSTGQVFTERLVRH